MSDPPAAENSSAGRPPGQPDPAQRLWELWSRGQRPDVEVGDRRTGDEQESRPETEVTQPARKYRLCSLILKDHHCQRDSLYHREKRIADQTKVSQIADSLDEFC